MENENESRIYAKFINIGKRTDDAGVRGHIKIQSNKSKVVSALLDLDGLYGFLTLGDFAVGYKAAIHIKIEQLKACRKEEKIRTKFPIKTEDGIKYPKELYYFKIGHSVTKIGMMQIYFMFLNSEFNDITALKFKTIEAFKRIMGDEKLPLNSSQSFRSSILEGKAVSISGILSQVDFLAVFTEIQSILGHDKIYIYCETFGNKEETRTTIDNYMDLEDLAAEIVESSYLKHFLSDICVSVSCGSKKITFAKKNLFETLGICPNYSPLLSNDILNANFSAKKDEKTYLKSNTRLEVFKYNLYSTFKQLFPRKFTKDFRNNYSTEMLCRNSYKTHLKIYKKNKEQKFTSYEILKSYNEKVSKEYFYRLEFMCKASEINLFFEKIITLANGAYFSSCDSENFFKIMQGTFNNSLKLISIGKRKDLVDFNEMIKISIVESLTNLIYIKGHKKISIFGKIANDKLPFILGYTDMGVSVVNFKGASEAIFKYLDDGAKLKILRSLVIYNTRFNDFHCKLFTNLFKIFLDVQNFRQNME